MSEKHKVKIAHLGMIQGVVSRMMTGSFSVKGYVVGLLVALLIAYSRGVIHAEFGFILGLPFLFLFLDLYYLRQERIYRRLYRDVAGADKEDEKFNLEPSLEAKKNIGYFSGLSSLSIWPFYLLLGITVAAFLAALRQC